MRQLGITRIADVTGLDRIGIPVYAAIRPNARSLAVSQGKGIDHDAARTSALMESIEHWHAEHIHKPTRHAPLYVLGDLAMPISNLHGLSPAFSEAMAIDWIEGFDLLNQRPAWAPLEAVSIDLRRSSEPGATGMIGGNGLASGNHLLEATIHALCEVIERDATTLWFLNTKEDDQETRIDLETLDDPGLVSLVELIDDAGLLVGLYDQTSDLGIPAFGCIVSDAADAVSPMGYFWGFGCHLSPSVAASRAITEAVQCRLPEIAGSRDDVERAAYALNRSQEELEEIESSLRDTTTARPFRYEDLSTDTFEGDLALLCKRLVNCGFESAVAIDLSRPELGVAVVHVLVPGLEGCFSGTNYRPGPRGRRVAGEKLR